MTETAAVCKLHDFVKGAVYVPLSAYYKCTKLTSSYDIYGEHCIAAYKHGNITNVSSPTNELEMSNLYHWNCGEVALLC